MRVSTLLAPLAALSFLLGEGMSISAQDQPVSTVEEAKRQLERDKELNDVKLLAQKAAMPSLAGDDKFILRESWWSGSIEPGKAKLIQVQLFRRNEYQFWLAVPSREAGVNLNVYDAEGTIVPAKVSAVEGSNLASVVVEPKLTGVYYVRISLQTTTDREQDWAVIYAYR